MKIDDLNDEIQFGQNSGPRNNLLSPIPLQHAEEILLKIPPRKKFIGPRNWYKLLKKLNQDSTNR